MAILDIALTGAALLIIDVFVFIWWALVFFKHDIKRFVEKRNPKNDIDNKNTNIKNEDINNQEKESSNNTFSY